MTTRRAALALLCAALFPGYGAAQEAPSPTDPDARAPTAPVGARAPTSLRADAGSVIDGLILTYGESDLSALTTYLEGTTNASPNDVVPYLSLGHAFLNRFERAGDADDFLRAVELFEVPARETVFPAWGNRWATSITLSHLMKGLHRLRRLSPDDAVLRTRIDVLWDRVSRFAADEADRKLSDDLPYRPYDSSSTGDSKAEENAWEAAFLAWASGLYPDHPRATAWEEKGRVLASLSIVRPSDGSTFKGMPVATVHEDFTLENHALSPNPYYSAATLMLLRMGALAYRMTGREIPAEYERNAGALNRTYRNYCVLEDGRWIWTLPADPVGGPDLWPFPGLDEESHVRSLVSQKLRERSLWLPTPPVAAVVPEPGAGLAPESAFGRAVQDAKVAWYYLDSAYLWLDPALSDPARRIPKPPR